MKGMRERLQRKLKSTSIITPLKQGLVFLANFPNQCKEQEHQNSDRVSYKISSSEFLNDVKDEDNDLEYFDVSETEILGHPIMSVKEDHKIAVTSLLDFEKKCPPGGNDLVILYTTSLRGIRKTFEDCNTIKFLLESFRVLYYEKDVSMHMEFREELWRILGVGVVPPRLFIRGRFIGGADEVVRLHEQGKLQKLLEGIPVSATNCPCHGCAGVRFVLCCRCNGSRKIRVDDQDFEMPVRCPDCNENGLVQCPICSSSP